MDPALLAVLRCPFCDGCLEPAGGAGGEIVAGILTCDCCAFPVVEGIPCMQAGPRAEEVMGLIGEREADRAACLMLGADDEAVLERLRADDATFRLGLELLGGATDTSYALFRFSDPTFLASDAVVRSIAPEACPGGAWALDACGGSGHLTRSMTQSCPAARVILADISFWELWLARRFVAPSCHPVWCDANAPLPFARASFSFVLCSDAFHYVWSRRLFARELQDAARDDGVVALPHLHNATSWNYSEGMPLSAERYRALFDRRQTQLYSDAEILDARLEGRPIDLMTGRAPSELGDVPALTLLSTRREELFRAYEPALDRAAGDTRLVLNPLYEGVAPGVAELRFPSEGYELEFGEATRRYLPDRVEVGEELLQGPGQSRIPAELVDRRVVLDVPERYL